MKLINSFITGISIFTGTLLAAQDASPDIQQQIFDQTDIRNQAWSISQNPQNGLIYIASSEGLIEYNGIQPETFVLPFEKIVRSVTVDDSGTVFTGAFEEIGFWNYKADGSLEYHSLNHLTNIQKNDEIWKIHISGGKVYFQSFTTIYVYDYHSITSVKTPFIMLFLFRAGEKFIVQAIDQGLFWFDGLNFTYINNSRALGSMKIHGIVEVANGNYLICTASHGIYHFDGNEFTYWNSPVSNFLKSYTCNAAISYTDSLYIFGSILNGVILCDANGNIRNHFNFTNGLKNNTVLSLYADNTGGVWAGLDDGVNYIDLNSPATYYTNTSGTLGTIYSVLRKEDKLYMGTNHGLFQSTIRKQNNVYFFEDINIIAGSQGQVWLLKLYDDQVICGHNEGTFIVQKGNLRKISDVTGGWSLKRQGDFLLEGTYTGMILLEKDETGAWKYRNRIEGFIEPTRHVETDYLGFVWASHARKGIYRIKLSNDMDSVAEAEYFSNISEQLHNTDVFSVNNRIVFTTSEQLYTYDHINLQIIPFLQLNEALGEYRRSTQIIPYERNQYWFLKDQKLALFDISIDFTAVKIREIVLEGKNIPERDMQVVPLDDTRILIPGRQGFSVYDLGKLNNNITSDLFIQKMIFQGRNKTLHAEIGHQSKISVPHFINNLTVHFADPVDFVRKGKTYSYRLPEIDSMWRATQQDNFTWLNLPHGKYHLQIRSDTDNRILEKEFRIRTPWYLSKTGFLIYFILLLVLIYTGIRIFRYELNKHRQILEYEVNRNRLENELDSKSQELMFTMRYLIQKNEILTGLKEVIDDLKKDVSRYPVKHVKTMEKFIHEGLESQTEEWRNAIQNLKLSEQGFFKRLLEAYPDLTPNDLRLCSYLRMNFSSKEIAKLLNISARGVEISRYRLRRKLHIGHEVNLTEFLMQEKWEK